MQFCFFFFLFFFNDTATTDIYTLSLHDALPILLQKLEETGHDKDTVIMLAPDHYPYGLDTESLNALAGRELDQFSLYQSCFLIWRDRKSTRLNSSHVRISYAVFCLKKKI